MSPDAKETLGVIGAGWVGLVTAASFAELGHEVIVLDVDRERVEGLRRGEVPIFEPGLKELLKKNDARLDYTLSMEDVLARAGLVFVCVGTPPTYSGDADLAAVWAVIAELESLSERLLVVMKSTVPVGTGAQIKERLDRKSGEFGYVANPEFLAEGRALEDFRHPDRVVVGAFEEQDAKRVAALYAPLGAPLVEADVHSAEMIKLAANAFLATRLSFINEIANVCELTGADVVKVAEGVGLDHRLGPHYLRAGLGWGGSCLFKDSSALKQLAGNSGYHFQLLSAVIEVNELQKRRVVQKLEKHLGSLVGKRVALLGLAFKPNTNDLRDAPSLTLAARLLAEGAEVVAWDPLAIEDARDLLRGAEFTDDLYAALRGADAAVVVTEWDEVRQIAAPAVRDSMRTPLVVDGRNLLDPKNMRALGFTYEGIGRNGTA